MHAWICELSAVRHAQRGGQAYEVHWRAAGTSEAARAQRGPEWPGAGTARRPGPSAHPGDCQLQLELEHKLQVGVHAQGRGPLPAFAQRGTGCRQQGWQVVTGIPAACFATQHRLRRLRGALCHAALRCMTRGGSASLL